MNIRALRGLGVESLFECDSVRGIVMRGIGNHTPPAEMQDEPIDNTGLFVWEQVGHWAATGTVVHTEIAREIAAQFTGPNDEPLNWFVSNGRIVEELPDYVEADYDRYRNGGVPMHSAREDAGNPLALAALHAYLKEALESPADDSDPREDGPSLMHEEMMDAREEDIRGLGSVMGRG